MAIKDNEFLKFAHELAETARKEIIPYFRKSKLIVDIKSGRGGSLQPVTVADKSAELAMRDLIRTRYPNHGIVGEEYENFSENNEYVWFLDPIDGTKSFIAGLPTFGTMIGLTKDKKAILGLIDQPITGDRIWGSSRGAFLNGNEIQTRRCKSLKHAIFATTDPDMFIEKSKNIFIELNNMVKFTRYGTDCWGYAMLAAGHIDIVIERNLKPWDTVAAYAIVNASGGSISGWNGNENQFSGEICAAGDPKIHKTLLNQINK